MKELKRDILTTIKITFFFIVILISCEKEDDKVLEEKKEDPIVVEKDKDQKSNSAPEKLDVSVLEVTSNSATINWNPAYDADGDSLFYSVFLNDSVIVSNVEIDLILKIDSLKAETEYRGKVAVTDSINDPVFTPFGFLTKKEKAPESFNTFSKVYHHHFGTTIQGSSIEETKDGGYIIAGNITLGTHFLYIIKIDPFGNKQWSKVYDENYAPYTEFIRQTQDGGFVVVSWHRILRLNHHGEIIWQYPKEDSEEAFTGNFGHKYNEVLETSDQAFIATGQFYQDGNVVVSRIDKNGELLWEKFYGQNGVSEGVSICESKDGNYLILGTKSLSEHDNDFWLIKINSEGQIIWEKVYDDGEYNFAEQIKPTSDDGCVIAGHSLDHLNNWNARILKINSEGGLEWDKAFNWRSGFYTPAHGIVQTNDGGFVFTGRNGDRQAEGLLVKLNEQGDLVWKRLYKPEESLDYVWAGKDVKQTQDGGYIISGVKSWIWNGAPQERGLWILKTDDMGNL